jgi:hypothetical protein
MAIIKECKYDNQWLEYWDVVIIEDDWYRLWVVKSTYNDWKTDCSWHYIKVGKWKTDLDLCWEEIIYKLTWPEAEIIKNLILTGEILEDKDEKVCELKNSLEYHKKEFKDAERSLNYHKNEINKIKGELEKIKK